MISNLLAHLKVCTDKNWLWYCTAEQDSNLEIIEPRNISQELYQLTKERLTQISSLKIKSSVKLQIALVEANPIQFLASFLAGIMAEVDLFLVDPAWQRQEWQQVLSLVKFDLIFSGDRSTQDLITQIQAKTTYLVPQKPDCSQQCLIMIPTGGSSGKIRFTMHNWSTLTASVMGFQAYFTCQKINSFCTLPLYHVSGLMQFIRSFITQSNLIICPYSLLKTKQLNFQQHEYFISLVPTQLDYLITLTPDWLRQFKIILLGGAPSARSLLNLAKQYQLPLAPTYGMTETASQIATLKPADFLAGNHSSGQVLPHAKIEIEPTHNTFLNQQIGLIKITCSSLCLGYYPQFFQPKQLFTTDDLGYVDRAGYLHLVGRNSQKIITGGENVFPTEVEAVIWSTKLVKDVCVVGIADQQWGEVVTAIYVPLASNPDLDLIKTKIKSQLAKYKQPKNWIKVDKLPRNNRGKINYQKVKAIPEEIIGNR
jgi:O-succinylbenzoic acid--CoA ligase